MSEDKAAGESTLVEKWIRDQQEWQRTAMEYFDSMVKNDEFLVHLGNAMRGSLLAGKPYPGTEPAKEAEAGEAAEAARTDERIDAILHALHRLQGEVADLKMTIDDIKAAQPAPAAAPAAAPPNPGPGPAGSGEA